MNEKELFLIWQRFLDALRSKKSDKIIVIRDGLEMVFPRDAIKYGINDLGEQIDMARKEAESLITVIEDIQDTGAVYDTELLKSELPWDRG